MAALAVVAVVAIAGFMVFGKRRKKAAEEGGVPKEPQTSTSHSPPPSPAGATPAVSSANDRDRDQARRAITEAEDIISDLLVEGIDTAGPMQSLELARAFQNDGDFTAALEFSKEARSAAEAARKHDDSAKTAAAGKLECPTCGEPLEAGWPSCPACMHKLPRNDG